MYRDCESRDSNDSGETCSVILRRGIDPVTSTTGKLKNLAISINIRSRDCLVDTRRGLPKEEFCSSKTGRLEINQYDTAGAFSSVESISIFHAQIVSLVHNNMFVMPPHAFGDNLSGVSEMRPGTST